MKIEFDEQGKNFIEIKKESEDKIFITLSSQVPDNNRKTIVNSVELTLEQFKNLISNI